MRIANIAHLTALIPVLAIASCTAGPQTSSPQSATASAAAHGAATVLAVRPISAVGLDQSGAWRNVLLDGAAGSDKPQGSDLAEFIVRDDAGATLSIVQSNVHALHPGDRVVIAYPAAAGGRPNLVRLL
jgi:hypothetical protein